MATIVQDSFTSADLLNLQDREGEVGGLWTRIGSTNPGNAVG